MISVKKRKEKKEKTMEYSMENNTMSVDAMGKLIE